MDYDEDGKDYKVMQAVLSVAIDNGWTHRHLEDNRERVKGIGGMLGEIQFWDGGLGEWGSYCEIPVEEIIFSHSFAKAFWGEEKTGVGFTTKGGYTTPNEWQLKWQFHLQAMVLKEEPIKYLEQFLTQ